MSNQSKQRVCPACGEEYSARRPRCPKCGQRNDQVKDRKTLLPRHGLLDLIPGLRDLPDTTKYLIASISVLLLGGLGALAFLILRRP